MKKFIINILILCFCANLSFSQTVVSGSIRRVDLVGNSIEVVARPSADLNAQVGNINITLSIPDQTLTSGTNPTLASIVKSTPITNVVFASDDPMNPYIIGNRAYYSFILLQNLSGDVATSWLANTDNVVATFTFPTNSYFSGLQLSDLTNTGGGPNFQMTWYVQFQQGIGDVTNVTAPFYGSGAVNNGGTSEQFATLQPPGTLPVKFTGFAVTKINNQALLKWNVENEDDNTDRYELERSVNGASFEKFQTINASKNGRSSDSYSFILQNLSSIKNSGVIYFRIKQIDKDGKFVYTDIKNIRLSTKGIFAAVYPNPIKQSTTLTFDLVENSRVTYSITDVSGKTMETYQVQGFKGSNIKTLNLGKYAAGAYTLKVQAGDDVITLPIVKATN